MRKFLPLLLLPVLALAQKSYSDGRAFNVTSVQPTVTIKLNLGRGFVVGGDGKARTCPDEKNVGTFVRVETKAAPNFFQSIDPKQVLVSTPQQVFTIACLKVE